MTNATIERMETDLYFMIGGLVQYDKGNSLGGMSSYQQNICENEVTVNSGIS